MSLDLSPDNRAVLADLDSTAFREGVARGWWEVQALAFPYLTVAVAAADRPESPTSYGLRINLSGFPQVAPTSSPWDLVEDRLLEADDRPRGGNVGVVFRTDWAGGAALYAPFDRVALADHKGWRTAHPTDLWTPQANLRFLLIRVHRLLQDEEYTGCGRAAA